jgi:ABC-type glycerol-3-phosphate transport system permease component
MIATSTKVDREMFTEQRTLFPKAPHPRIHSPYIDETTFPDPKLPEDMPLEEYGMVRDNITKEIHAQLVDMNLPVVSNMQETAVDELVDGLWGRVLALTPYKVLTNTAVPAAQIVRKVVTQAEINSVLKSCYRRFSLRFSRVRDQDMKMHNLALKVPITGQWHSLQPHDMFLTEHEAHELPFADVHYSFAHTNQISMQAEFELPFAASNLLQYTLGYRPDDTWHRIYVTVEGGGRKMQSKEPVYLFDYNWSAAIWQHPSEQDKEIKIKRWILMDFVDEGSQYDIGQNRIRVTVTLKKSSEGRAWAGKIWRNYRSAFKYIPFWRYVGTSAFLVILNIIGTLFASSFVAYSFARLRWPGREICFLALLATLMIPPQVTMIPGFIIMKWFGWYNTLQPLWVFSFCGNAFYIFLLRQFMKGIPSDLEDAARIDGCGFLRIYWNVILPLIKPSLAAIAIFTFMGVWNDFMGPLIMLNDHRLYPLSLGLFSLNVQAGGNLGMMMSSSFLMTLPVIIIFFFAQKYFIQGVTLTGMKG